LRVKEEALETLEGELEAQRAALTLREAAVAAREAEAARQAASHDAKDIENAMLHERIAAMEAERVKAAGIMQRNILEKCTLATQNRDLLAEIETLRKSSGDPAPPSFPPVPAPHSAPSPPLPAAAPLAGPAIIPGPSDSDRIASLERLFRSELDTMKSDFEGQLAVFARRCSFVLPVTPRPETASYGSESGPMVSADFISAAAAYPTPSFVERRLSMSEDAGLGGISAVAEATHGPSAASAGAAAEAVPSLGAGAAAMRGVPETESEPGESDAETDEADALLVPTGGLGGIIGEDVFRAGGGSPAPTEPFDEEASDEPHASAVGIADDVRTVLMADARVRLASPDFRKRVLGYKLNRIYNLLGPQNAEDRFKHILRQLYTSKSVAAFRWEMDPVQIADPKVSFNIAGPDREFIIENFDGLETAGDVDKLILSTVAWVEAMREAGVSLIVPSTS
jgi:hypothetical protein